MFINKVLKRKTLLKYWKKYTKTEVQKPSGIEITLKSHYCIQNSTFKLSSGMK